jgi:hypothetical protein
VLIIFNFITTVPKEIADDSSNHNLMSIGYIIYHPNSADVFNFDGCCLSSAATI